MATNLTIAIERESDRSVFEKLDAICEELKLPISKIAFKPIWSDQDATANSIRDGVVEKLTKHESILSRHIAITADSISIKVMRFFDAPEPHPFDHLSIYANERPQEVIAALVEAVRTKFTSLDAISSSAFLTDAERQFANSQRVEIEKLLEMQRDFFKQFTAYSAQEANRVQEKLAAVDSERKAALEEIEQRRKVAIAQVEAEKSTADALRSEKDNTLDAKLKAFETREARYVRRDQFTAFLKGKTKEAAEARVLFGKPTLTRQIFVAVGFGLLLVFFVLQACGVFDNSRSWSWLDTANQDRESHIVFWFNLARRMLGALGCVITLAFFVKWLNGLAIKYSGQDLHEIAFSEDFMRANWLMEIASEWRDANQEQIPEYVVERMSRNLFSGWKPDEPDHTTAIDSIGAAMKGAKFKAGDVEFVVPIGKSKKSRIQNESRGTRWKMQIAVRPPMFQRIAPSRSLKEWLAVRSQRLSTPI